MAREELTFAELSRELAVSPSVLRRWHRLSTNGSAAAVGANELVVPVSELRAAQQRIKELERALGKKAMEIEILQAARDLGGPEEWRPVASGLRTIPGSRHDGQEPALPTEPRRPPDRRCLAPRARQPH